MQTQNALIAERRAIEISARSSLSSTLRHAISVRLSVKLDEILLAIPGTDHALLTLEHASDDELPAAASQYRTTSIEPFAGS